MKPCPNMDMELAETAIVQAIAQVESELNSSIQQSNMPKGMLMITRAQLFGVLAQVRIHNYLCGSNRVEEEKKLVS